MNKFRTKAYWLLLFGLMFTATAVTAVGETQARYTNTVSWDTVVEISEDQVRSDLLRNATQAPMTVQLGQMSGTVTVPFTLESGVDVEGPLTWSVSPSNYTKYFTVEMSTGGKPYQNEAAVRLIADKPITVNMRLTPKGDAFTTPRDAVSAVITVQWGESLEGTFHVELPAVASSTTPEPEEEDDGDEDISINVTGQSDDLATDGSDIEIDIEINVGSGDETEPIEGGEAPDDGEDENESGNGTDIEIDIGGPSEGGVPSVPEKEEPESDSKVEVNVGVSGGDNNSEPDDDPETDVTELTIASANTAAVDDQMMLRISAPKSDGITKVRMGIKNSSVNVSVDSGDASSGTGGADSSLLSFPARLCYSLDGGQSYTMLYHGGLVEVDMDGKTTRTVLLDFSQVDQKESDLELAIVGYQGDTKVATDNGKFSVQAAQPISVSSRFLTEARGVTIGIPAAWRAYTLEYTLERLTEHTQNGGLTYVPVDLKDESIKISWNKNAGTVIVQMGEKLPQAGSYRVTLNWISEGNCIRQEQETFFINYLTHFDTVETGGAAQ